MKYLPNLKPQGRIPDGKAGVRSTEPGFWKRVLRSIRPRVTIEIDPATGKRTVRYGFGGGTYW